MHTRKVQKVSKETYEEIRGFVVKHPDVETAFVAKHYGLCETLINYARRMTWAEFLAFKEERRQQYHQRKRRQAEALAEIEAALEAEQEVQTAPVAPAAPEAEQTQMVMAEAPGMDAVANPDPRDTGPELAEDYTLNDYQQDAARTISAKDKTDMMAHALYGLASEVGELHGIFQKTYQGHQLDPEHIKREMGDILWMLAELATALDWTLGHVARTNIDKLRARYPDGFNAENSLHRRPGDV